MPSGLRAADDLKWSCSYGIAAQYPGWIKPNAEKNPSHIQGLEIQPGLSEAGGGQLFTTQIQTTSNLNMDPVTHMRMQANVAGGQSSPQLKVNEFLNENL